MGRSKLGERTYACMRAGGRVLSSLELKYIPNSSQASALHMVEEL